MSYSFNATGSTRDETMAAVGKEFDKVITNQPIHSRDRAAAVAAVGAMIDLLSPDIPEGHIIQVGVHGAVGWSGDLAEDHSNPLRSASVGASAHYYKPQ